MSKCRNKLASPLKTKVPFKLVVCLCRTSKNFYSSKWLAFPVLGHKKGPSYYFLTTRKKIKNNIILFVTGRGFDTTGCPVPWPLKYPSFYLYIYCKNKKKYNVIFSFPIESEMQELQWVGLESRENGFSVDNPLLNNLKILFDCAIKNNRHSLLVVWPILIDL